MLAADSRSGPLRLGIIGAGAITETAHLPAAFACADVEVTALVDASEARLTYMRDQYALACPTFTDYRACMPLVDAVVLALPNALHASIGSAFLEQGIHVLCEKPLAVTEEECRQLCAAAERGGAVLAVGFVTRFFPSTMLVKRLIDERFLGTLESFDYEFGTAGGWAPLSGYNLSRAAAGGGVLVISGSHFVDRMLHLFGEVEIVRHEQDARGGVEANCVTRVTADVHGDLVQGRITLSKTHVLANRLRVAGSRGVLEVREGQSETVTFLDAATGLRHEIGLDVPPTERNNFATQIEDFAGAIRTGRPPRIDGAHALKSVAFTERCYALAVPLDEPWVDATIDRLRSAFPVQGSAPTPAEPLVAEVMS